MSFLGWDFLFMVTGAIMVYVGILVGIWIERHK